MRVKLTRVAKKQKETQFGTKTSVGIQTEEFGDRWLNGWANQAMMDWKAGDIVYIVVEENGEYLNFKQQKSGGDDSPKVSACNKEQLDRLEVKVDKVLRLLEASEVSISPDDFK